MHTALIFPTNKCFVVEYISNSPAVKIGYGPPKGQDVKGCEIKGGGQDMVAMMLNTIILNNPFIHPGLFVVSHAKRFVWGR